MITLLACIQNLSTFIRSKGEYHQFAVFFRSDRHAPPKLLDDDFSTAWVARSMGEGEPDWIEIRLQDFCLQAVGIINGLPSDKDTYYEYNRIKRLKIEIELDEYDFFTDQTEKVYLEEVVELEDKPFSSFNPVAFAPFLSILADLGQSFNQAHRVRLTV